MISFGERCYSNQYDKISNDEFSDDEISAFADTTKFPATKHKLKVLEHLQQIPDATIDDILLVIQQREETVQFVNKQNGPNETVSFARNGQLRRTTGNDKISAGIYNKAKECSKCGTKHEPRSCPAFGKSCNNCKKPNHFAKVCRVKKQKTTLFEKKPISKKTMAVPAIICILLGIPTISSMVQWRKSK